jgi:hypothetical protein
MTRTRLSQNIREKNFKFKTKSQKSSEIVNIFSIKVSLDIIYY